MVPCHRLYLSTRLDLSSPCQLERSHNKVQTVVRAYLEDEEAENSFETLPDVNGVIVTVHYCHVETGAGPEVCFQIHQKQQLPTEFFIMAVRADGICSRSSR